MFKELTPLNHQKDSQLRYLAKADFSFAKEEVQVPIMASEFTKAAKIYAVVFPASGTLVPQGLLGVTAKENLFVNDQGQWPGAYIPLHFRRYPFVLGQMKDENKFVIMIDRASGQFSETEGEPLYSTEEEKTVPSELLKRITQDLTNIQNAYLTTKNLVKPLEDYGVLAPYKITLGKGELEKQIRGLRVVDWKKVVKLEDKVLAEWVRSGLMQLIQLHLMSLENVKFLQGRRLQQANEQSEG
jgi:hypothetical protein